MVNTTDGYMLRFFRIPSSPKLSDHTDDTLHKPAVLLQHGFTLTSDAWVISDPSVGLAYRLADAGFDVWLGNQRGNSYSQNHITLNSNERKFWDFSWHEIGYYDLAAMFDYILGLTDNSALHYVGYSQGTSTFMVLLSSRPEYREKVKTIHLMAPVVYMHRMKQPLAKIGAMFLDFGESLANIFGFREVLQLNQKSLYRSWCHWACSEDSILKRACKWVYEAIGGFGTKHINEVIIILRSTYS